MSPLYALGQWLVDHFGPAPDPAQDAAERQREITEMANAVAEMILLKLAPPPPRTGAPLPVPKPPPTFEQELDATFARIRSESGASDISVFDRTIKAMQRGFPDHPVNDIVRAVDAKMRG